MIVEEMNYAGTDYKIKNNIVFRKASNGDWVVSSWRPDELRTTVTAADAVKCKRFAVASTPEDHIDYDDEEYRREFEEWKAKQKEKHNVR